MGDVVRQSHSYYPPGVDSPRQDPTYIERVADVLLKTRGRKVHLEAVLGGDPWVVSEAVQCLRRLGWVILADKGHPGYTFTGWSRPQRWLRLDTVYHEYTGAIILRPKRPRKVEPLAGQVAWC